MAGVRILIQFTAESAELAESQVQALAERSRQVEKELGCVQFEAFRSVLQPEKWAVVELWESQEALDVHARTLGPRQANPGISRVSEHYEHHPA